MNNKDLTIKYCPYQKLISTEVRIPNYDLQTNVSKVINTSVTFGKCLMKDCPFWDHNTCNRR